MSSQDIELSTVISATMGKTIKISDKPLPQGGKIRTVTHKEFKEIFGAVYCESMLAPKDMSLDSYKSTVPNNQQLEDDKPTGNQVLARLENPLDCFVICKMDNKVGYGVFVDQDIPAETVLFLYSGEICEANPDDIYMSQWLRENRHTNSNLTISSKQHRGIAAFMQHLPLDSQRHKKMLLAHLKEEIKTNPIYVGITVLDKDLQETVDAMMEAQPNIKFSNIVFSKEKIQDDIAWGNIRCTNAIVNGIPVIVGVTIYDIKKGSQIGSSYGDRWWLARKLRPQLFKTNGDLLELNKYRYAHENSKDESKLSDITLFTETNRSLAPYDRAIIHFKNKQYPAAISILKKEMGQLEEEKSNANPLRIAKHHSTLASCYRDSGEHRLAITHCGAAIEILSISDKADTLKKVTTKLHRCLTESKLSDKELYAICIEAYKAQEKQLNTALIIGEYVCSQLQKNTNMAMDTAICHSVLASCHRDLGNLNQAQEHCEKALEIIGTAADSKEKSAKTQKITEKLSGIIARLEAATAKGPS